MGPLRTEPAIQPHPSLLEAFAQEEVYRLKHP
jgi:hypothetical protein